MDIEDMIRTLRSKPYRIDDERILEAVRTVQRDQFVPSEWRHEAFSDRPLPIGEGQTISQPFMVACMTAQLKPEPHHRVLEIGAGSGYQAAVLSKLVEQVYTIEIVGSLAEAARKNLKAAGCDNVHVRHGDGAEGWPDEAPFDGIILTCAPIELPENLRDQVKDGGRLVYPAGGTLDAQRLYTMVRQGDEWVKEEQFPVRFVPMTKDVR